MGKELPKRTVITADLEELYDEFNLAVVKRLGGRKGDKQIAIKEAIKAWIKAG